MKRRLILTLATVCAVVPAGADTYPRQRGVDVEHYRFELAVSDDTDEIAGVATIELRLLDLVPQEVQLDLIGKGAWDDEPGGGMEVVRARWLDSSVATSSYSHENGKLTVPLAQPARAGDSRRLEVTYRGSPATGLVIGDNKHGERCFFSDNWPNKARHWLPMIDHPYDKATADMVIVAPAHYQVVSNGLLVEETDLADGYRRTHWRQSVPIASWLYALGVARFAVQNVGSFDGRPIQTWVYADDRDAGFYDFAEPTEHVLEFFSDYVGPYPYEKLANVQSNSVGGGMESATAIFYGDDSVTGERSERWRNVVIHEIAHQWFGNSVTEEDWDDVWLSEGFATYFTLLFIEHAYGRDEFVVALERSRDSIFSFQDKRPDYRLVHDNLDDMRHVLTGQIYQKGAWTLHMLRGMIGDDAFRRGIRDYYRRFRDANATTDDFRQTMERAAGRDLEWFFDQWLYRGGSLVVDGGWSWNPETEELAVTLDQVQEYGEPYRMPIELEIVTADGESTIEILEIDARRNEIEIAAAAEPVSVTLDPKTKVLMRSILERRNDGKGLH